METERKVGTKQEIIKEAKENEELYSFVKSLTKEEIKQIKEQREFEDIKTGSYTYKIALLGDSIRSNLRTLKLKISKRLWSIDDLTNNIRRIKVQLESKLITEKLKTGEVMTEPELITYMQHHEWLREGEVVAIPISLAEMRAYVGHKDIVRNVVMSEDEFNLYVAGLESELAKRGFKMFGELE